MLLQQPLILRNSNGGCTTPSKTNNNKNLLVFLFRDIYLILIDGALLWYKYNNTLQTALLCKNNALPGTPHEYPPHMYYFSIPVQAVMLFTYVSHVYTMYTVIHLPVSKNRNTHTGKKNLVNKYPASNV